MTALKPRKPLKGIVDFEENVIHRFSVTVKNHLVAGKTVYHVCIQMTEKFIKT